MCAERKSAPTSTAVRHLSNRETCGNKACFSLFFGRDNGLRQWQHQHHKGAGPLSEFEGGDRDSGDAYGLVGNRLFIGKRHRRLYRDHTRETTQPFEHTAREFGIHRPTQKRDTHSVAHLDHVAHVRGLSLKRPRGLSHSTLVQRLRGNRFDARVCDNRHRSLHSRRASSDVQTAVEKSDERSLHVRHVSVGHCRAGRLPHLHHEPHQRSPWRRLLLEVSRRVHGQRNDHCGVVNYLCRVVVYADCSVRVAVHQPTAVGEASHPVRVDGELPTRRGAREEDGDSNGEDDRDDRGRLRVFVDSVHGRDAASLSGLQVILARLSQPLLPVHERPHQSALVLRPNQTI